MRKKFFMILFLLNLIVGISIFAADKEAKSSHSNKKTIKFNGYIQGWFKADFTEESTYSSFLVKRARLAARSQLTSRVSFKFMVDFAQKENILLDAYADIKIKRNLSLRFGQYKTPFSRVNLRSASDLYLIERPFYQKELTPPIRDIGFHLSLNQPKFQLTGGIFNGEGRTIADSDNIKNVSLRAVLHPISELNIAANIYFSPSKVADDMDRLNICGIDFHYQFSKLFLEWEVVSRQGGKTGNQRGLGFYLMGGANCPNNGIIRLEPIIRYECFDSDTFEAGDKQWQLLAGINLYNKEGNVKLSLNLGHRSGGLIEGKINSLLFQLQVKF